MIPSETLKSKLALSFTAVVSLLMSAPFAGAQEVTDVITSMGMSFQKTYREIRDVPSFRSGRVFLYVQDGNFEIQDGCIRPAFWGPNIPRDECPLGATGYITSGDLDSPVDLPYASVTAIFGANVVAPYRSGGLFLRAAPPSKLTRPLGGFRDKGEVIFFNILSPTGNFRQYPQTFYDREFKFDSSEKNKMRQEWVPGAYSFAAPSAVNPSREAVINNTVFPMIEGREKIANRFSGFHFTFDVSGNWTPDGFYKIKTKRPFVVRWAGVTVNNVVRSDKLYFSMKKLSDEANPLSEIKPGPNVFPNFAGSVRGILLQSPYVTSVSLPPLFKAGEKAVLRLHFDRVIQNSGIAYDLSDRFFEMPVVFVD